MRFSERSPKLQNEGSTIVANNRPVAEWHKWLDDHGVEAEIEVTFDSDGNPWLKEHGNQHFPPLKA